MYFHTTTNVFIIITIFLVKIFRAEVIPLPANGNSIEIKQAPYTAAIYVFEFYKCTGSYIKELWVLTSGYCIVGRLARDVSVVMGTNKVNHIGEKKDVVKLVLHPNFNAVPLQNDVGLVCVTNPFTIGDAIQRIQIIGKAIDTTTTCNLIGWGVGINLTQELIYADSIVLRQTEMIPVKRERCRHMLENETVRYGKDFIDDNVICAQGRTDDGCLGDVGAPLVCGDVQVGITSVVVEECGSRKPSLYTNVSKYRSWIYANTMPILSMRSASYSLHSVFRMCVLMILNVCIRI